MKILLVEDDVEISDMLKKFLKTEGFEVIAAYDGESALERFWEEEYSLVLLDLMIPKIDGMEVMNAIREKSMVPIIILSVNGVFPVILTGVSFVAAALSVVHAETKDLL